MYYIVLLIFETNSFFTVEDLALSMFHSRILNFIPLHSITDLKTNMILKNLLLNVNCMYKRKFHKDHHCPSNSISICHFPKVHPSPLRLSRSSKASNTQENRSSVTLDLSLYQLANIYCISIVVWLILFRLLITVNTIEWFLLKLCREL